MAFGPALTKRDLSAAEHQQRVDAAKARWAGYAGATQPRRAAQATEEPSKPGWTGERLGVARGIKVQASTTIAPTWKHNYDGREWGYGADGPPQDQGGRVYAALERKPLVPKEMTADQFVTFGRQVMDTTRSMRDAIIKEGLTGDRGLSTGGKDKKRAKATIPESRQGDTEAHRMAFNHARTLALHDVGLIRVPSFSLSGEAKEKLAGLEPFMWRARRQITNRLRDQHPEHWAASRRQFGDEFQDRRTYVRSTRGGIQAGERKRKFERHSTMVKRWSAASSAIA